ncbi:MAG: metallopeptidase family protein [Gemmatimonadota bacterium]
MTREAFEALVDRLTGTVPSEYFDGVREVVVSPRTLPHPLRAGIYTLGECIPLPLDDDSAEAIQSRIVLYYGSFHALAQHDSGFDWEEEAWETLSHELRHHVEWRARRDDLEALDRAAEQNYARHDGEPFDPGFYLDGDSPADGVYQVEDDWFLDRVVRQLSPTVDLVWHGTVYRAAIPADAHLPAYLLLLGVAQPPPGDLVLVLRRKPRLSDLFRRPQLFQAAIPVRPVEDASR